MRSNIEHRLKAEKIYYPPAITEIKLDNEISLALESDPPIFESENKPHINNHPLNDPYKLLNI